MSRRIALLLFFALAIQILQAETTQNCEPGSFYNITSETCQFCPKGTYSNTTDAIGSCLTCPSGSITQSDTTGNIECTLCPPGTYEINSTACVPCPQRTYSDVTGASGVGSCNACPPGTMGKSGQTGLTNCTVCPLGTYETGRSACNNCPGRTYSNVIGASGIESCIPCPLGTITKAGSTGFAECTVCQPGTYELDRQYCKYCPAGTYSNATGASGLASCIPCAPGSTTKSGLIGLTECNPCPIGTYETGRTACNYCPARTYSNVTGASGIASCNPCPPGTMTKPGWSGYDQCIVCQAGTYEADRQYCYNCPAGTYSNVTGASGLGSCKACAPGLVTKSGYTGQTECIPCPLGEYETNRKTCTNCPARTSSNVSGSGVESCIPCPPGTMTKPGWSGYDQCIVCQAGTYETDRQYCYYCPAGTYSNVPGASGIGSCQPCPPGFATKSAGLTECSICPPGTYESNGICKTCPSGTFSDVSGSQACKTCPEGTVSGEGKSQCTACGAGKYAKNHLGCYSCPEGTYSNGNADSCTPCAPGTKAYYPGSSTCDICPSGTYEKGRTSCKSCPEGTYSDSIGASGPESCIPCAPGTRAYFAGSSKCDICPPGTYENGRTSCKSCPEGTYSDSPGASESCIPCAPGTRAYFAGSSKCDICPSGTYESDRIRCVSCPALTYSNAVGASSSSTCVKCPGGSIIQTIDGKSVCTKCSPGTYEENGRCYACDRGTITSEEGSTSCKPCEPGSITISGKPYTQCVQCPAGTYEEDRIWCNNCPQNTYSNQAGASGYSACTKCAPGSISPKYRVGNTECVICPAGTRAVEEYNVCYNCQPGTYAESPGSTKCEKCQPGYVSTNSGLPNKVCKPCPENTYEEGNRYQCFLCFPGYHSPPGSTSCIKNFAPDSYSSAIQQNLQQINITDARDFMLGLGYSLFIEEEIEQLESMAEIPEQLENTFKSWENVNWKNGSSILSAIKTTAETGVNIYDNLPLPLRTQLEFYIFRVNPMLTVTIKAGVFIYNLEENIMDVTAHMRELHTALEQKDLLRAGDAIGDLIKDGIELRNRKKDLEDNTT